MFCARCGQQIPDASELCPLCGREATLHLTPQPAPAISPPPVSVPSITKLSKERKPVGGWLLFFCVSLTILTPIGLIATLRQTVNSRWMIYNVLLLVLSLVAGISVWMVTPNALTILKTYFITLAIWQLLLIGYDLTVHSERGLDMTVFFRVRTLVWISIWYAYFHNSQRVAQTFGRNI